MIFVNIVKKTTNKAGTITNKTRQLTDRALLHQNIRALANQIVRYMSIIL